MKRIPERDCVEYMSLFVKRAQSQNNRKIRLDKDFEHLRKRNNYSAVIQYLESEGLITIPVKNAPTIPFVNITNAGMTFLTDIRKEKAKVRWDRGLAIAAIIISLITFLFQFYGNSSADTFDQRISFLEQQVDFLTQLIDEAK